MIVTILKHEFHRTIKPMLIIVSIITLITLLGASLGLLVSSGLGLILTVFGVVALVPVLQWYLGIDFYISSYAGPGATLTHTLPISGRKLFWSKLLYALLVTAFFSTLTGAVMWIIFELGISHTEFGGVIREFFTTLFTTPGYLVFFSAIALSAFASIPVTLFFCAVIGSGGWARRLGVGGPVIVYVAIYLATQIIGLAFMWIPPGIDLETGEFTSEFNLFSQDANMPLAVFMVQVLALIIMAVWASRTMNKNVQLN